MDFALAKRLAEEKAAEFVDQPKAKCPKDKSCLMVVVYKEDTSEVIEGAKVQVSGTATDKKGKTSNKSSGNKTDKNGLAKFKPWDPGSYTVDISLPKVDGYEEPETTSQSVGTGTCPVCCVAVKPFPKVKVKVVQKRDHSKVFNDAVVKVVSAPQNHGDKKTKAGMADFGRTKSGKYVFQVTSLKEEDLKEFVVPKMKVEETLASGDDKTVIIEVEKLNIVTPKIEMEYKVVLFDRGLSKFQDASEEKIYPDPTYIQLSFRQTDYTNPFQKGAKVKFSPANVEVYLDEECKKKAPGDPAGGIELKPEEISNLSGHKLWLRGKKAGKFKVILELKDPQNPLIRLDKNPAEEEMGVVEIILKVFEHDVNELAKIEIDPDTDPISTYHTNLKNKELPKQVVMTSEKKVKVGRFLHAQKDKNFGRAKLVVAINASEWPSGTDAYRIAFEKEKPSGDVEIFSDEWEGDARGSFTVASLKGREQPYWLEGKSVTTKFRDLRLFLTLDRAEYGLPKTPKKNADWAKITVVQIEEVKVHYTPEAGKAVAWDDNEKRFYINFKSDPDGRKITIGAKLSQKLKDVTIHLMLAPSQDNMKQANWGVDLPSTWKWKDVDAAVKHKDKDDRKKLLHLSAKTDENGLAKKELVLSRFGGDKFWPAAYIDQDPHLAKYVRGHSDLEKKKPVISANNIKVWRKFWYKPIKVEGLNPPGLGGTESKYLRVKSTMEACSDLTISRATVNAMNPKPIYPRYMIEVGAGNEDALVVADTNKAQFFTSFVKDADKPIEIPALVCDAQWDAGGNSTSTDFDASAASFPADITVDKLVLTPPLQGGNLLAGGSWTAAEENPDGSFRNVRNGALSTGDLSVSSGRSNLNDVTVALPAGVGATTADTWVWITGLVVQGADGPYLGEYDKSTQRILAVYDPQRPSLYVYAVAHELGHAFFQVTQAPPSGVPNHPHQYISRGSHCAYNGNKCLMFATAPNAGSLELFCPVCHPYVLLQNMWELSR